MSRWPQVFLEVLQLVEVLGLQPLNPMPESDTDGRHDSAVASTLLCWSGSHAFLLLLRWIPKVDLGSQVYPV